MMLGLGQRMDVRCVQVISKPAMHVMCMIPLFELNLSGLKKFREYLEGLTQEEIEALGSLAVKGKGKKAFHDVRLETLLEKGGISRDKEPDVKLRLKDNELMYDFLAEEPETKFPPADPESDGNLIRNSKYFLRNVEWVMHALRQAYEIILEHQRDYLTKGKVEKLKHLTQEKVADQMGIHLTTLSRLIRNKSFRALDGSLMTLSSLIIQQEGIDKLRAYEAMGNMMREGVYPRSDEFVVHMIYERTGGENGGVHLARRTVSKYRGKLEEYQGKRTRQNPADE